MEAAQAHPSLNLSKCHIVGNHVSWLKYSFSNTPSVKQLGIRSVVRPDLYQNCLQTTKVATSRQRVN